MKALNLKKHPMVTWLTLRPTGTQSHPCKNALRFTSFLIFVSWNLTWIHDTHIPYYHIRHTCFTRTKQQPINQCLSGTCLGADLRTSTKHTHVHKRMDYVLKYAAQSKLSSHTWLRGPIRAWESPLWEWHHIFIRIYELWKVRNTWMWTWFKRVDHLALIVCCVSYNKTHRCIEKKSIRLSKAHLPLEHEVLNTSVKRLPFLPTLYMCRLASLDPISLPPCRPTHRPDPTDLESRYNIIHEFELRYAWKVRCQLIRSHYGWKKKNGIWKPSIIWGSNLDPSKSNVLGDTMWASNKKAIIIHTSRIARTLPWATTIKGPPLPRKQTNGRPLW